MSSSVPSKREFESTFQPSKRQKFSFPVDSVSDFKDLRDNGYFYADKTKYIKDIDSDRLVLMFLRPKRFGKSLLLSTIRYFYDIGEKEHFDNLFSPLEIYKDVTTLGLQHSQFLILRWNFSEITRLFLFYLLIIILSRLLTNKNSVKGLLTSRN